MYHHLMSECIVSIIRIRQRATKIIYFSVEFHSIIAGEVVIEKKV